MFDNNNKIKVGDNNKANFMDLNLNGALKINGYVGKFQSLFLGRCKVKRSGRSIFVTLSCAGAVVIEI